MANPIKKSRFGRVRRGVFAIEMALMTPVLMLMLFGVLEYGWLFSKDAQLVNAARQGARLGIRPNATNAQVNALIDNLMTSANMDDSGYIVTLTPPDVAAMDPGELLTVNIGVTYENIELVGFPLIPMPETISGEVSMVKEGPE